MPRKDTPANLAAAFAALSLSGADFNNGGWASARCPSCGDSESSPSLRVSSDGSKYRCFRCQASSAEDDVTLYEFVSSPKSPGIRAAAARGEEAGPPLTQRLVDRYHELLIDSPGTMKDLEGRRGWKESTIRALKLGWDGTRLWLPIYDCDGLLVNARMYDPFRRMRAKSLHYANNVGLRRTAVWVPHPDVLKSDTLWLMEGEPDTILAWQEGLPAIVVTGGVGTWTDELLRVVGSRRVVICADMDVAGERGSKAWMHRFRASGVEAVRLKFEIREPGGKDFTDAIMKDRRDARWFRKLAEAAWNNDAPPDEPLPVLVPLGGGVPDEPIISRVHIMGGSSVPLMVPATAEFRCRMDWDPEKKCHVCPVRKADGKLKHEIRPSEQILVNLAYAPLNQHEGTIRKDAGVPGRCPCVKMDTAGYWSVLTVNVIPPMTERHGGESTMRNAMYVSPADGRSAEVQPNCVYDMRGFVRCDPRSNEWLLVADDARPAEDGVDSFVMNSGMADEMRHTFSPTEWTYEAVEDKFVREERSLSRHVTRIYGRELLLRAIDLTFHTALKFEVFGAPIVRGWGSLCVVGDTRTGKSETLTAFMKYVGLGKMVMDPSNTTFAGLVGGLQQIGRGDKSWNITWGLIPTNDRGLVAVDELSSMSVDDIGRMSGMRSSGVAELTKIRSQATPARTRLIFAGNPRHADGGLDSYPTSVEALRELIGAPEDIARFDFAMAIMGGLDKDAAGRELGQQPEPIPTDLRRDLVRFAWSRDVGQITWHEGSEDELRRWAKVMTTKYHSGVPLVEPSEQELRIARIAVAAAIRTFSVVDEDPNMVLVRPCHVEFAAKTMMAMFDGDLAYDNYSASKKRQQMDKDEAIKCLSIPRGDMAKTIRALLSLSKVNPNTIGMVLGMASEDSRDFIARLAQCGAARFIAGGRDSSMTWTPGFFKLLREAESDPNAFMKTEAQLADELAGAKF